eukprot:3116923-Prymnesium_polylepis.1
MQGGDVVVSAVALVRRFARPAPSLPTTPRPQDGLKDGLSAVFAERNPLHNLLAKWDDKLDKSLLNIAMAAEMPLHGSLWTNAAKPVRHRVGTQSGRVCKCARPSASLCRSTAPPTRRRAAA